MELIDNLPSPSILKIICFFLLQADIPIEAVFTAAMRKIILLFAKTSPQCGEGRPHPAFGRIPCDYVDDAARRVGAV